MNLHSNICQNCSNQFNGNFCNLCGERVFDSNQRKVTVLIGHLIESLLNVDGKLIKTTKLFFIKPGFLAFEHWRGARKPYMTPVSFFLIVNVIYFLFSPLTDFALPLNNQSIQPYSEWVQPVISQYILEHGITFEELAARYDTLSGALAKSLVILSVPFLLPFIWIVNPQRRYYLLDHAVSALYLYAFVLVWPMIFAVMATSLVKLGVLEVIPSGSIGILLLIPYLLYAIYFQKFMYQNKWYLCIPKGAVILIGIIISHFIYRFVQFWIVWWQIT